MVYVLAAMTEPDAVTAGECSPLIEVFSGYSVSFAESGAPDSEYVTEVYRELF